MNLFFLTIIVIHLSILFAFVLTNPCLNLRKDKNDGLKIFTSSTGIRADDGIGLIARKKRSISGIGGFVKLIDNQLYSDDNDLISSIRQKVYLPVYVLRTKRFALKTRTIRSAVVECPWQEATFSSSTGTDYYPKKPSDKQSVDVLIGGNIENKKNKEFINENINSEKEIKEGFEDKLGLEEIKTIESTSTTTFKALFD